MIKDYKKYYVVANFVLSRKSTEKYNSNYGGPSEAGAKDLKRTGENEIGKKTKMIKRKTGKTIGEAVSVSAISISSATKYN